MNASDEHVFGILKTQAEINAALLSQANLMQVTINNLAYCLQMHQEQLLQLRADFHEFEARR